MCVDFIRARRWSCSNTCFVVRWQSCELFSRWTASAPASLPGQREPRLGACSTEARIEARLSPDARSQIVEARELHERCRREQVTVVWRRTAQELPTSTFEKKKPKRPLLSSLPLPFYSVPTQRRQHLDATGALGHEQIGEAGSPAPGSQASECAELGTSSRRGTRGTHNTANRCYRVLVLQCCCGRERVERGRSTPRRGRWRRGGWLA